MAIDEHSWRVKSWWDEPPEPPVDLPFDNPSLAMEMKIKSIEKRRASSPPCQEYSRARPAEPEGYRGLAMDDETAVSTFPTMNTARVTDILRAHGFTMEQAHRWMNSPTPWLSGEVPSLVMPTAPLRVLTAARRAVSGPLGGNQHDHAAMDDRTCCAQCKYHAMPHAGCIMR